MFPRRLGLFLFLLSVIGPSISAATPPNIVFCIADDWSWPHASIAGDRLVQTPNFDQLARDGVLFENAFCAAPSCTPSRASLLTGQAVHRLKEGGNLWGFLPKEYAVFPDLLEKAGYRIGLQGKGWGPGNFQAGGRTRNPAGPNFRSFAEFLATVPTNQPFYFWYGSSDPHRPYQTNSGAASGMNLQNVVVPPFLPDNPVTRSDLADYYFEVQRFDRSVGEILKLLAETGRASNTLVVVSSDNGMPFPRAKANIYDSGTRVPLVLRWPGRLPAGRKVPSLVSLTDLAPTFLESAGLAPLAEMTGKSLLGLCLGREKERKTVFLERERHANVRKGDLSYPVRAIRTERFLYIWNLRPQRWPAGDPEFYRAVGPYGDCDGSPTKEWILAREKTDSWFYDRCFGLRPAAELYDLRIDPFQLTNVVAQSRYRKEKKKLHEELVNWMKRTGDPRATHNDDRWDAYPYFGR